MSIYDQLELQPQDPILNIPIEYAADQREMKANLGVGAYRDAEGKPKVMDAVREAEHVLLQQKGNKEYLPIDGMQEFILESQKLVFGEDCDLLRRGCIAGVQTVGGSGALNLGGELINGDLSNGKTFLPEQTWPNHQALLAHAHLEIQTYPYYDVYHHHLDFDGMCEAVDSMPERSVVLLQASCHNPTGVDLTFEQWKELSVIVKKRRHLPFFDIAYQGFGEGLEEDAASIRHFVMHGHEMLVAVSHSKNFGLYGERVGHLSVVTHDPKQAEVVRSNLKKLIRRIYSNPPLHGAAIVKTILQSPELKSIWIAEQQNMLQRVKEMRSQLTARLVEKGKQIRDFSFIEKQRGFFSYLCLNRDQVQRLKHDYGIYMAMDSRINVAGLIEKKLDYVVDSILKVVEAP